MNVDRLQIREQADTENANEQWATIQMMAIGGLVNVRKAGKEKIAV